MTSTEPVPSSSLHELPSPVPVSSSSLELPSPDPVPVDDYLTFFDNPRVLVDLNIDLVGLAEERNKIGNQASADDNVQEQDYIKWCADLTNPMPSMYWNPERQRWEYCKVPAPPAVQDTQSQAQSWEHGEVPAPPMVQDIQSQAQSWEHGEVPAPPTVQDMQSQTQSFQDTQSQTQSWEHCEVPAPPTAQDIQNQTQSWEHCEVPAPPTAQDTQSQTQSWEHYDIPAPPTAQDIQSQTQYWEQYLQPELNPFLADTQSQPQQHGLGPLESGDDGNGQYRPTAAMNRVNFTDTFDAKRQMTGQNTFHLQ
ncbi:hypothetical protein F66182_8134 [Fusarium sp. NRRL 66182]|nr:hypothetical protein F66182_8134 [Fusarium sp. NRRL 66182]